MKVKVVREDPMGNEMWREPIETKLEAEEQIIA
jgi:hypothetical protein